MLNEISRAHAVKIDSDAGARKAYCITSRNSIPASRSTVSHQGTAYQHQGLLYHIKEQHTSIKVYCTSINKCITQFKYAILGTKCLIHGYLIFEL